MLSELINDTSTTLTCHTNGKRIRHPLALEIWEDFLHTTAGPSEEEVGFVFQLSSNCCRTEKQQGEQEFHRVPLLMDSSSLVIAIFISSSVLFVSFKTPVRA